jgi:Sec region non-globular protein
MKLKKSILCNRKIQSIFLLGLLFNVSFYNLQSEEYSIRKKKPQKKQETTKKGNEPPSQIGFSRENNKISNQFWLEEGAIYTPESLEISSPVPNPESNIEPKEIVISNPIEVSKPQEEPSKNLDKSKQTLLQKPNIVLQFLSENKKIVLIIGLLVLFAIYRLRGDSSSRTNQNTRIFSKFRNK